MWIWLLSNIAGSLLGAATTEWFKGTKAPPKESYKKLNGMTVPYGKPSSAAGCGN